MSEQVKREKSVEASVLPENSTGTAGVFKNSGSAFLRLQSDERLVSLARRGNESAFEVLVLRYRSRLQAFCRHMVGSTEDAEDILQEVFVAAHKAMLADDRPINVRPWLYRIARNRSLNHLRRPRPTGVDSMDIYESGAAASTADRVHDKLELEDLIGDVKTLPETQRTALLLREMGALSYDQIAVAMDTSVPSVKSLLVRARVSLAEASEARKMTCEEVRVELAADAEGIEKISPPAKRHVQGCERCRSFKKELAVNNRKLAILAPIGLLAMFKHLVALKLLGVGGGWGAFGIGSGSSTAGAGAGAAAAGAGAAGAGVAAAGAGAGLGMGAIAGSAAAGLATVAIAVGGVAQVASDNKNSAADAARPVATAVAPLAEQASASRAATASRAADRAAARRSKPVELADTAPEQPVAVAPPVDVTAPVTETAPEPPPVAVVDEETSAVVIDPAEQGAADPAPPPSGPTGSSTPEGGASSGSGGSSGMGDAVADDSL